MADVTLTSATTTGVFLVDFFSPDVIPIDLADRGAYTLSCASACLNESQLYILLSYKLAPRAILDF